MSTNLVKKHSEANSFRILTAMEVLRNAEKPKVHIQVKNPFLYQDNIRVHYVQNGYQSKSCKIMLEDMTKHVLEAYYSSNPSDITVYYYIEENLEAVCQSYLEAGKEIIEL